MRSSNSTSIWLVIFGIVFLGLPLTQRFPMSSAEESASGTIPEEPEMDNAPTSAVFEAAVGSYRKGHYGEAQRVFSALHRQYPEQMKTTYYLAITEAQLGRFEAARRDYNEIIKLDPHSEEGTLAQEGLNYLPAVDHLDLPPHFQQANEESSPIAPPVVAGGSTSAGVQPHGLTSSNPGNPDTNPANNGGPGGTVANTNGLSPQDMMALQMMMGGSNNGNNSGNNWMNMFAGMGGNNPGSPPMDPAFMSTMMQQQMIQNMNLGESGNKNE